MEVALGDGGNTSENGNASGYESSRRSKAAR